jgi:hypothetical protein
MKMKVIPSRKPLHMTPKLGFKLSTLAAELECSVSTLKRNIQLPPDHPRHLPAFKIGDFEWRVHWKDFEEWVARNRNDVEVIWNSN